MPYTEDLPGKNPAMYLCMSNVITLSVYSNASCTPLKHNRHYVSPDRFTKKQFYLPSP